MYFTASSDSLQKDLLKLVGNIPVRYQGETLSVSGLSEAGKAAQKTADI